MRSMKILVTGGAGFIGSNFIRYMLSKHKDHKIVNLDKLTYAGNLANLKDVEKNKNYKFVKGDICDKKLVGKLTKEVDCIINFAAESHVDRSIDNAASFIKTNVFGAYALLEAAKNNRIKRFIQISTDEVCGSILSGKFSEASNLAPNSPYSASKASAEMLARSYYITYNLPVIITRSSNNFGPYQYPEKIVPLFITNLILGMKVPLYGKGLNVRDWLFVADNCSALDLILHKAKAGEIYNIGAGNEMSNIKLTKIILKKMGLSTESIRLSSDRMGHDRRYALNINKIKRLGWQPKYSFNEAIDITINWYKENKVWWKHLKKY